MQTDTEIRPHQFPIDFLSFYFVRDKKPKPWPEHNSISDINLSSILKYLDITI